MAKHFTVATLAERWGVGTSTVKRLLASGDLKSFRVGVKLLRIKTDEVERFEQEGPWPKTENSRGSTGDITSNSEKETAHGAAAASARLMSELQSQQ